ncbi:MAG TPA: lytic transglycosylase domain-containing protein [Pseudomonadales bacterium]
MHGELLLLSVLLWPAAALAERVTIPVTLDPALLEALLRAQVFTDGGDSVRLNDDGSGCQYLVLREPEVSTADGEVRVRVNASARAGRAVGDRCLLVLDWRGRLELVQQPALTADASGVVLHTRSWRALRADGSTDTVSTTVGGWIEQLMPLGLRETRVDLLAPLAELGEFLALVLPAGNAVGAASGREPTDARALLASLRAEAVGAGPDGVTVTVAADAPPQPATSAPTELALSAAELAALEDRLDALDAFFTNLIVHLGERADAPAASELFEVLVELRRDLVAALGERQRAAVDPARALFVEAWSALAPVLQTVAARERDADAALRWLGFIGAGDALRALDALGPAVGVDVSSQGLRRLARILIRDTDVDPLRHDDAVNPALRRALGFGPPLPPPDAYAPDATWLDWLIPAAVAADSLDPALVKRLNNWVPRTRDMEKYLPMVREVLHHVVERQLAGGEVARAFHDVFRWLVFAAAWQESCWRQFTARDDLRVPVESASGDLGMMQVNPRVWRGLYDLHGLRWDIVYNAAAGADILAHYLIDYAIRHREHETTGTIDSLARSAYAAYNGGPRQYDRYRSTDASAHGRQVDALFYEKYREVKGGGEMAVTGCYVL